MVFTSLQVCMDSSDWLQGTLHEESGMDSSSSPSGGDMLTCSRPLIERRLRPQHDQPLKCPRCESTHTKFCYYNNYSLSQPRYFCKTCRRYWTKGGTLRNIPVGGGCRKNKKSSSNNSNNNNGNNSNNNKKPPPNYNDDGPHNHHHHHSHHLGSSSSSRNDPTDLHLAFSPEAQISHLSGLLGGMQTSGFANPSCSNFLDMSGKFNSIGACSMGENPARPPIDFLESKVASYENFMLSTGGDEQYHHHLGGHVVGDHMSSVQGLCVQYNGMIPANVDGHLSGHFMAENCQRLMQMPYDQEQETGGHDEDHHHHHHAMVDADVKPSPKLLTLEWQDQGGVGSNCCDAIGSNNKMISSGGGAFGYFNGLGSSWGGIMSDYSSSAAAAATNPLV